MSRRQYTSGLAVVLAAAGFLSTPTADAHAMAHAADIHASGTYRSVINGIPNYDGFDRFRDVNGNPLPGWEQELSSPG